MNSKYDNEPFEILFDDSDEEKVIPEIEKQEINEESGTLFNPKVRSVYDEETVVKRNSDIISSVNTEKREKTSKRIIAPSKRLEVESEEKEKASLGKRFLYSKPWKVIYRVLIVIFATIMLIVSGLLAVIYIMEKGPSEAAKQQFVCACKESSAMGFVTYFFLSSEEVDEIVKSNQMTELEDGVVSNPDDITIDYEDIKKDDNPIEIMDIKGTTYKGKLMIVKDPSRIFVGTVDTFFEGRGLIVEELCAKYGAIAGINGGEFFDIGTVNYTALPVGGVISEGKAVYGDNGTVWNITGFTNENKLVIGKMTVQEAIDMGVRDAVHTKHETGPFLVYEGKSLAVPGTEVYGGGLNPRTAIGQRADGAVILLVVDGRQASSAGATFKDLARIMIQYGAVYASAMDGGTSTQMVYDGETINSPYSPSGPRRCPTSFLVK